MKILIMGGSGSLSGCVARTALERGHEVWTVTRKNKGLPKGVHPIIVDRNQEKAFEEQIAGVAAKWDAVLDCICMNAAHARQDIQVLGKYASRVVGISTDSVYDPEHKHVPQSEQSDYYLMGDDYAGNKRKMELEFLESNGSLHWTLFRTGHIYGPGFEIGCYPEHFRSPELLEHIRADKPLRLVGGGHLLTHPTYVQDLADCMLESIENEKTYNEIFCIGGPKAVENRYYYEVIGQILGHPVTIEAISDVRTYAKEHPKYAGALCERSYTLEKLKKTGMKLPSTPIEEGLRKHIAWLEQRNKVTNQ